MEHECLTRTELVAAKRNSKRSIVNALWNFTILFRFLFLLIFFGKLTVTTIIWMIGEMLWESGFDTYTTSYFFVSLLCSSSLIKKKYRNNKFDRCCKRLKLWCCDRKCSVFSRFDRLNLHLSSKNLSRSLWLFHFIISLLFTKYSEWENWKKNTETLTFFQSISFKRLEHDFRKFSFDL